MTSPHFKNTPTRLAAIRKAIARLGLAARWRRFMAQDRRGMRKAQRAGGEWRRPKG